MFEEWRKNYLKNLRSGALLAIWLMFFLRSTALLRSLCDLLSFSGRTKLIRLPRLSTYDRRPPLSINITKSSIPNSNYLPCPVTPRFDICFLVLDITMISKNNRTQVSHPQFYSSACWCKSDDIFEGKIMTLYGLAAPDNKPPVQAQWRCM